MSLSLRSPGFSVYFFVDMQCCCAVRMLWLDLLSLPVRWLQWNSSITTRCGAYHRLFVTLCVGAHSCSLLLSFPVAQASCGLFVLSRLFPSAASSPVVVWAQFASLLTQFHSPLSCPCPSPLHLGSAEAGKLSFPTRTESSKVRAHYHPDWFINPSKPVCHFLFYLCT